MSGGGPLTAKGHPPEDVEPSPPPPTSPPSESTVVVNTTTAPRSTLTTTTGKSTSDAVGEIAREIGCQAIDIFDAIMKSEQVQSKLKMSMMQKAKLIRNLKKS